MHSLKVHNYNNPIAIDRWPDQCPICKCYINPTFITGHCYNEKSYNYVQGVFQCVNQKCWKIFISTYKTPAPRQHVHYYNNSIPVTFQKSEFSKEICELSPNFEVIYNQAAEAEALNLTEICGAGYRKALEFLVKDYLISLQPDQEDVIKDKFLSKCIHDIPDENIKFCAERATWLGNDEVHYIRKWEEKDLTDLKALIHLMINWLNNELLMKKYREEMASGRN